MGERSPLTTQFSKLNTWLLEPCQEALARGRTAHADARGNALAVRLEDATPGKAYISVLQGEQGRLVGAITAFEDVTVGRTAAEQALAVERRRKEIFVWTLAHELRQPLSTLRAAVEVIRLAADSADARQVSEIMQRQIGQMSRMVEDLLDAARWARGKVTLRTERLDVREVIRDAALDVTAAVSERGHELVVTTASEPLWVDADPQRLRQLLSNLLRNAVKYTDPGGRISIAAEPGATTVTLRVSDTGRGIEPEALTRIFDLFAQLRPSEAAGVGIGLSVVREIVTLHKGWIEARSEGPGRGSEFIVTLPAGGCQRSEGAPPLRRDYRGTDLAPE